MSGPGTITSDDSILSAIEKLDGNQNVTSIIEANGFGSATGPDLTLSITQTGLLAGLNGALTVATDVDVTSKLLTNFASAPGTVSSTDSILSAIGKLDGNQTANTTTVNAANGFGSATGPDLTLTTTQTGLLAGSGGALTLATDVDVTSKLLTNLSSVSGTVTSSDSILSAIGKLNANVTSRILFGSGNQPVSALISGESYIIGRDTAVHSPTGSIGVEGFSFIFSIPFNGTLKNIQYWIILGFTGTGSTSTISILTDVGRSFPWLNNGTAQQVHGFSTVTSQTLTAGPFGSIVGQYASITDTSTNQAVLAGDMIRVRSIPTLTGSATQLTDWAVGVSFDYIR